MNIGKRALIFGLSALAIAAFGLFVLVQQPSAAPQSDSDQGLVSSHLGF